MRQWCQRVLMMWWMVPMMALAQVYPTKPVRLIVPWPPGTPADVIGRVVGERMSQGLGHPVLIDNKPGVVGTIGLTEAMRQPADGYTLYMLSSASLVAPLLFAGQNIDFGKSLQPVGMMVWSYNVLVVPADSPIQTVQDLVARARAQPGALNSAGSATHR